MLSKCIFGSAAGIAAVMAIVPTAASAQSYGVYAGPSYPAYGYYQPPRAYYYDDERREAWRAHERWEERQRWAQEQARRRYWQHERWEHRGDWREDDDER